MKIIIVVLCFLLNTLIFVHAQIISKENINIPGNEKLIFQNITYISDDMQLKGFIVEPIENEGNEKLPVIIFNRGGNRSFAQIDTNTLTQWIAPIARSGYIVVASQYRGSVGSMGKDEFGGNDVDDILNLIPLLKDIPRCDTTRIGMYGWSRGGMMTYLALTKTSKIKAAVVGGAPTDMFALLEERPKFERLFMELIPDYKQIKTQNYEKDQQYFGRKKYIQHHYLSFMARMMNMLITLRHGTWPTNLPF